MGWLGWTAEAALATDVNLVVMALDERSSLIRMVFGDGKPGTKGKRRGKMTAEKFKAFAASHNRSRGQLTDG